MAAEDGTGNCTLDQNEVARIVGATFRAFLHVNFAVKLEDGSIRGIRNKRELRDRINSMGIAICEYAFKDVANKDLDKIFNRYCEAAFQAIKDTVNDANQSELVSDLERIFREAGKKE